MGLMIALAVLVGILSFPLGFRAIYRQDNPGVWLLLGPFRLRVYPRKNKRKKSDKNSGKQEQPDLFKGGRYSDFLPIVRTIYAFLGEFRRKIRVRHLALKLVLAGDDPADLAVNYGRACAALGSITPLLERLFVIKKRKLEVECDFNAEETLVYARIDATLTLMRAVHLLSKHGIKIIKDLLELKKLRKGGNKI